MARARETNSMRMQALEEFGQNSGNKEIPVNLEGRNILPGHSE